MATNASFAPPPLGSISDHRRRRWNSIIGGVSSAITARVIGVLAGFLSVPLTIKYLGAERYGAWITIGSTLTWLQLTDPGVGHGLTNAITTALANDRRELARAHISTAFFVLLAIVLLTASIFFLVWPHIDWASTFGVHTATAKLEIGPAIACAVAINLLQLPLSIIGKVLLATQEGKLANYWAIASSIVSLLSLIAVTRTERGLPWLVLAVSGVGLMITIVSGLWLFRVHKPFLAPSVRLINKASLREIGNVGIQFFLIQIAALLNFQTDNLVIAHYLGAAKVAPYNIAYKLFGYTGIVQMFSFQYIWAAYSDSLARGDFNWIRHTFIRNLTISTGSTILLAAPLCFFAAPFINFWAGASAVPTTQLCLWMAAWNVINASTSPIACLFAATGHLRAQLIYAILAAAANIALSIFLVRTWGVSGVIVGTVFAYLIFVCVPCAVDALLLLKKLSGENPSLSIASMPADNSAH